MDSLSGTPQIQNMIPTTFFKTDMYAAGWLEINRLCFHIHQWHYLPDVADTISPGRRKLWRGPYARARAGSAARTGQSRGRTFTVRGRRRDEQGCRLCDAAVLRREQRDHACRARPSHHDIGFRRQSEIEQIRKLVYDRLGGLVHKVRAIVNYESRPILPELLNSYSEMVADVSERFYLSTTRYTTSGFLRIKSGDALSRRQVAAHIYETANEARAHLHDK